MDSMLLDNLEEAIFDEGKIVSFKWISSLLDVPFNAAKQILYQYLKHIETTKPNEKLNPTYLLSGLISDGGGDNIHQICVVDENELETLKPRIRKLYSLHIYSLQKCALADKNLITVSNENLKDKESLTRHSGIVLSSLQVKEPCQVTATLAKPVSTKDPMKKDQKSPAKSSKKRAQSGIGAMFANQVKKNEKIPQLKKEPASQSKKSGGLANFLVKGLKHPPPKEVKVENKEIKEEEPMQVSEEEDPLPKVVKTYSRKAAPAKRKGESEVSGSKRRRIMTVESSDSSSEEEEEPMEECPLPPTPPKAVLASDSDEVPDTTQEPQKGKRRVKKLISKIYEDKDGFLVTKKEYEIVSEESDGEEPVPPPKISSPTKINSPAKGKTAPAKKQASIMNFFKKK